MGKTTIVVVDDSPFASKQIKDIVEENGLDLCQMSSVAFLCVEIE